ncbi:hypothetical protein BJ165DRAFT_1532669 [Panaeolus papilionaceus]|nr:hypothetical protein BJ165DRAFT_1532669 [Panaeolus papilionaceus]
MEEEPADAPAAQVPVHEEDSVVQKTDYTVTDRVKKRKFGNTTTTTYLKEVKKSSLFIRTRPYSSTCLNITCNFNE